MIICFSVQGFLHCGQLFSFLSHLLIHSIWKTCPHKVVEILHLDVNASKHVEHSVSMFFCSFFCSIIKVKSSILLFYFSLSIDLYSSNIYLKLIIEYISHALLLFCLLKWIKNRYKQKHLYVFTGFFKFHTGIRH